MSILLFGFAVLFSTFAQAQDKGEGLCREIMVCYKNMSSEEGKIKLAVEWTKDNLKKFKQPEARQSVINFHNDLVQETTVLNVRMAALLRASMQEMLEGLEKNLKAKTPEELANSLTQQADEKRILQELFARNKTNVDFAVVKAAIDHYTNYLAEQIKQHPLATSQQLLGDLPDQELKKLRGELGRAWPLVKGLTGFELEGEFAPYVAGAIKVDGVSFEQAKRHYAKTKNPLGRLYALAMLKRLDKLWTDKDVISLKADLNLRNLLLARSAILDFKKIQNKWPSSMSELTAAGYLKHKPLDYFSGDVLRYSVAQKKLWSVGENKVDDQGLGDDVILAIR